MGWEIRVKVGHPNEYFRRDGIVFTKSRPVILEKPSKAIMDEPILVKKEVKGKEKDKGKGKK